MSTPINQARAIFLEAIEKDSPEYRAEFLERACQGNPELRARVERLLQSNKLLGSFHDEPWPAAATVDVAVAERPGTVIGHYKLLQQIGEGGMGVVFMAEQTRPVQRTVALKIIKPGMDTRQVISRFEAERQALAMMDHPNIAKVLDAGMTGEGNREQGTGNIEGNSALAPSPESRSLSPHIGRPYFVMELVQGVPITEYCDECNLTTQERLKLFIIVCQAVQHAHQKGIIHRDLKPTNVLVAIQDGQPSPKIIDFGVAKAIDQRLTEHTLTTAFAQMIGTPMYMSPEQAELSPLGVDTRSDIYSLGVLLYELLTGTTPFDKDRLHAASYDEMRRIIREEEPPRPSARISTFAADKASTIAEHRRTDARRLTQQVRSELDWIVMKCLDKDRNRRYETPNSLARDIERYLHDEPVQACPPSAVYRLKKFVRRNKVAAAFIGLLTIGLAALAVSNVLIQSALNQKNAALELAQANEQRATTESARAKAVSDLLQEMLGSADAARAKGADYKVRELLDDFSARLGHQLTDEPAVEADIHATIGRAYRSLKLPDKAQPHFEKAIELRRRNGGPQSEKLAAILIDGAWNLLDQQRSDEAESQLHEALAIYRSRGVTGAPLFHALEILQHILRGSTGREEDAERVTQQALAVARESGQEFPDQANLLHRYADLKIRQGHYAEAEQLARQSVDMHRRLHGDGHPETAFGLKTLARALASQQRLADAEAALREALLVFRRQFPEDHPNIRDTMYQLRTVLEAGGDKTALETLAKEEAEIEMRSDSPGYHLRVAGLLLSNTPTSAQKEARRLIRQAMEGYVRVAVDSPDDLGRRLDAAEGYLEVAKLGAERPDFADEVDEAHRRFSAEIQSLLVTFPNSPDCQWRCAMLYRAWAFAVEGSGRYLAQEEHAYREAIKLLEKHTLTAPDPLHTWLYLANTHAYLGDVLVRSTRLDEAGTAFRKAMQIYDDHAAEFVAYPIAIVAEDQARFAYFLATTQREKEAADILHKAALAAQHVGNPIESGQALAGLAIVRLRLGDEAGYREACAKLVQLPFRLANDHANLSRIRICCLGPDAVDDPSVLVKLAEDFAANNSLGVPYLGHVMLGSAHFRARQYEQASRHLEEFLAQFPSDAPPSLLPEFIMPQLLLAMTKWQLGEHDEARRILRELQPRIDETLRSSPVFWDRPAVLEIRRREAETMIKPEGVSEAVENKGTNDE